MPNIAHKGVVPDGALLLKTFGPRKTLGLYRTGLSDNWLSLKLVLIVGTAPKGNYVMYWNGERIGGKDFVILEAHQPEVAGEILRYLKENFPNLSEIERIEKVGKTERTSEGIVPENAPKIGELKDIHKSDWSIYAVDVGGDNKQIKIVAAERLTGRANYLVTWNGRRFIRDAGFSRLAERVELLAAAEDFMESYAEKTPAEVEPKPEKTEWINLGPIGVVVNLDRDLLVKEVEEGTEVRLSTSDPDVPTKIYFSAKSIDGELSVEGVLYNSLRRDTPEVGAKVEELLNQYFLEKDFY